MEYYKLPFSFAELSGSEIELNIKVSPDFKRFKGIGRAFVNGQTDTTGLIQVAYLSHGGASITYCNLDEEQAKKIQRIPEDPKKEDSPRFRLELK